MDGKCPKCGIGGRLKSEHRVFKRGDVSLVTEQRFWVCSFCHHEWEDGLEEANAASVEEAWKGVEDAASSRAQVAQLAEAPDSKSGQ